MERVCAIQLVVRDYDEAIAWYRDRLDFVLVEDVEQPGEGKRWVAMSPRGGGSLFVLGRARDARQASRIGDQTGGRVAFFLATDDFERSLARLRDAGVVFVRQPSRQAYGTVAVFEDLYGNLWDIVEFAPGHPLRPTEAART